MSRSLPSLTIGIPVYNQAERIGSCISSVLSSVDRTTGWDIRVIVSDNCSTDATPDIIAGYLADARMRLIRQPRNLGAQANFSGLLKGAESDYFCWIGSDDAVNELFFPDLLNALSGTPSVAMAYGKTSFCFHAPGGDIRTEFAFDPFQIVQDRAYSLASPAERVLSAMSIGQAFDYPFYGVYRTHALRAAFSRAGENRILQAEGVLAFLLACGPFAYVPSACILKGKKPESDEQRLRRYSLSFGGGSQWRSMREMVDELHEMIAQDYRGALLSISSDEYGRKAFLRRWKEQCLSCYGAETFGRIFSDSLRGRIAVRAARIVPRHPWGDRALKLGLSLVLFGPLAFGRTCQHLWWQRRRKRCMRDRAPLPSASP